MYSRVGPAVIKQRIGLAFGITQRNLGNSSGKQQPSTSANMQNSIQTDSPPVPKENAFLNIGFNIVLPIFVLNQGKKRIGAYLEPYFENVAVVILLIALLFPISYFIYDYYKRNKYNFFSILGLVSVLLTGGIGVLAIPTQWFAIKEAAVPFILGVAVIISLKTPWPLIRTLLYNPEIIDVNKVQTALRENGRETDFEKLLEKCTLLLAGSFFLSSLLNYILARWIVVSPSGTDAFNAEVSRMWVLSWPAIVVPGLLITTVALWMLFSGIKKMTGLNFEAILALVDSKDQTSKHTPHSEV